MVPGQLKVPAGFAAGAGTVSIAGADSGAPSGIAGADIITPPSQQGGCATADPHGSLQTGPQAGAQAGPWAGA